MNYTLKLVAGPEDEPISLEEVKAQILLDGDDQDDYLSALITVGRQAIENEIQRPLGVQTFEMGLECWPYVPYPVQQRLPRPPFSELISIKYTLEDDSEATLMDTLASPPVSSDIYTLDADAEPASIYLKRGETWPTDVLALGHPIKIRYKAGYAEIPAPLVQAILLTIGHLFANRESVVVSENVQMIELPQAVKWLCQPYKFFSYR